MRRLIWLLIVLATAASCRSTFPASAKQAERIAETFREQRRQGAAWFEVEDREMELRLLAASAAQLEELLRSGKLEPGAAFRFKDQEMQAP